MTIDVSVRRRNVPVTGLTARDFDLFDNGVRQAIDVLTMDTVPVDVTLVIGRYYARVENLLTSDLSTVVEWLRPIDRLSVIAFATDVREILPMGAPGTWAQQGLTRAKAWLAGRNQSALDSRHDPKLRGRSVFDALLLALARPPEVGRRHLIVGFCSGLDESALSDGSVLDAVAARADALLHVACTAWHEPPQARNPEIIRQPLGGGEVVGLQYVRQALADAAAATGGAFHENDNGVGAFKSILDDFRRSYLLQYTVTGVPPGGWHTVVVRTPGFPQYDVQFRRGYMGR